MSFGYGTWRVSSMASTSTGQCIDQQVSLIRARVYSKKFAPPSCAKAGKVAKPQLMRKCAISRIADARRNPSQGVVQRLSVEMCRDTQDSTDARSFYLIVMQCSIEPAMAGVPTSMVVFLHSLRID